jgi:hypothetical protein
MVIWKYVMKSRDLIVEMPKGAQILSCQMQDNLPSIWIMARDERVPKEPKETRRFISIETGNETGIPVKKLSFIDTIQFDGGRLVYHVFEVLP